MRRDECLDYAGAHLAKDLRSYSAGLAKWDHFLKEAAKLLPVASPAQGNRRLIWLFGRPYFVDFQWVQNQESGYGHHGYVENFGQLNERYVAKYVAKITDSDSIETHLGTIRLTDENALQSYHAKCLTLMDDEIAKKVEGAGESSPRARSLK